MKRILVLLILGSMVLMASIPTSAHATRGAALLTAPQALALPASAWPADTVMEEGRVITAADVHRTALAELADRFAIICRAAEIH